MTSSSKNNGTEQLLMFEQLFKKPELTVDGLVSEERKRAFDKGYAQAQLEMKNQFALLQKVSDKLLEEKRQLLERMKPEVIDFCLQLTEQILRQELSDPAVLAKLISSLLVAIGRQKESLSVVLAPEDLEIMESFIPTIEAEKHKMGHIYFSSDPTVQKGDVRIECNSILVNCAIARELESVRAHLLRSTS